MNECFIWAIFKNHSFIHWNVTEDVLLKSHWVTVSSHVLLKCIVGVACVATRVSQSDCGYAADACREVVRDRRWYLQEKSVFSRLRFVVRDKSLDGCSCWLLLTNIFQQQLHCFFSGHDDTISPMRRVPPSSRVPATRTCECAVTKTAESSYWKAWLMFDAMAAGFWTQRLSLIPTTLLHSGITWHYWPALVIKCRF